MTTNAARWRLDGQTALVSGASRGIGFACARELAALGADVLLVARDETHLDLARAELAEEFPQTEFLSFAADVADREQRLEVFDWVADLEIELSLLVNNVGGNVSKPALEYTDGELRAMIDTNVLGDIRDVPPRVSAPRRARQRRDRERRVGLRPDPCAHGCAVRHDQGRRRTAHAQPRVRMGRGRHPRQRGRAVVHPHAAHGRRRSPIPTTSTKYSRARRWGASASPRRSPRRSRSCACLRRRTSRASASRSTAAFCATVFEEVFWTRIDADLRESGRSESGRGTLRASASRSMVAFCAMVFEGSFCMRNNFLTRINADLRGSELLAKASRSWRGDHRNMPLRSS